MTTVKSPLGDDDRKVACDALQSALVDLVDLSLQGKQMHWNIVGRHFHDVHLHLDEVVATARQYSDMVAERAVTLGANPDGRAHTVADHSGLAVMEPGYQQDDKVVATMVDRLGGVVSRMREHVAATEKADPVTQDLFIEVTRALEEHYWMFQASL